jgi:hypothetical protein
MQDMDLPMEAMSDSQSRDVPDVDVLVPPAMLPLLRTTNPSHLQGSTLSRCSSIALDYLHMMSSFIGGTQHKYMALEVASDGGHDTPADLWATCLYTSCYTSEATLRNIVHANAGVSMTPCSRRPRHWPLRRGIPGLLHKNPQAARRLGSRRSAADVKAHPFFKSLDLALLRSSAPPVVPPEAALHANRVARRRRTCRSCSINSYFLSSN